MPLNAQQALQTLPPLQAVGDVFKAVFGIYHRKLSKLIDAVLLRVAGSVISSICSNSLAVALGNPGGIGHGQSLVCIWFSLFLFGLASMVWLSTLVNPFVLAAVFGNTSVV